jgi:hypothetical protein
MAYGRENLIDCSTFEESLSEYLEKSLDPGMHKGMAAHALQCPLCHSLLNDVKDAVTACHMMAEPRLPVSRLEARILAKTIPDATIQCKEFEEHLTDYLDGFLPANVFHRWERHAVLCDNCTDLPGMVVRSLATIVNYKLDELPLPFGLHERILQETIGTKKAVEVRSSMSARFGEWVRGLRFPISVPQLAPVAMMTIVAFLVFSQTVSADGSLADVYAKSYQLAEQTYKQGADALNEATGNAEPQQQQEPITGTTDVNEKK